MIEYVSMRDVKRENERAGGRWFDPSNMRWFGSRMPRYAERDAAGRYWFVSSEQDRPFTYSDGSVGCAWDGERRYTIRRQSAEGSVDTVGEFGEYQSRQSATAAMRRIMREDAS